MWQTGKSLRLEVDGNFWNFGQSSYNIDLSVILRMKLGGFRTETVHYKKSIRFEPEISCSSESEL